MAIILPVLSALPIAPISRDMDQHLSATPPDRPFNSVQWSSSTSVNLGDYAGTLN